MSADITYRPEADLTELRATAQPYTQKYGSGTTVGLASVDTSDGFNIVTRNTDSLRKIAQACIDAADAADAITEQHASGVSA